MGKKRIDRLHTMGMTNANRWKFLSAQDKSQQQLQSSTMRRCATAANGLRNTARTKAAVQHPEPRPRVLVPIRKTAAMTNEENSLMEAREIKLAQRLREVVMKEVDSTDNFVPSNAELNELRKTLSRRIYAEEFVSRNEHKLWRYGKVFAGKSAEQAIELIAMHPKFPTFFATLEVAEHDRGIRTSRKVGESLAYSNYHSESSEASASSQTVVQTSRKRSAVPRKSSFFGMLESDRSDDTTATYDTAAANNDGGGSSMEDENDEILKNLYGAIDVDGDGVIDDSEMQMNTKLKSLAAAGGAINSKSSSQLLGRKMMAIDFVKSHRGEMWKFDPSYANLSEKELVDLISGTHHFAHEFTKLKTRERLLKLTGSRDMKNCLSFPSSARRRPTTSASSVLMTTRAVKSRSELFSTRKSPSSYNVVTTSNNGSSTITTVAATKTKMTPSASVPSGITYHPRNFVTPIPITPIKNLTITR